MFKLKYIGPEAGDCTAPYNVIFEKEKPTVKEFIKEVIRTRPDEWGVIKVWTDEDGYWGKSICIYNWGKADSISDKWILKRKIKSATASGGWTRMDYLLWLEDKSETEESGGDSEG